MKNGCGNPRERMDEGIQERERKAAKKDRKGRAHRSGYRNQKSEWLGMQAATRNGWGDDDLDQSDVEDEELAGARRRPTSGR